MDETELMKQSIVSGLFATLLEDRVLDLALEVHERALLKRLPCDVCGTLCKVAGLGHAPPPPQVAAGTTSSSAATSRANTPVPPAAAGPSSSAASSGKGKKKDFNQCTVDGSGNAFYDCLNCGRATVSTKYANHLSKCLGLNRRTTGRSAAKPSLLGTNGSDADSLANGNGKKIGPKGVNKRAASPAIPSPKLKKAKVTPFAFSPRATPEPAAAQPTISVSLPPAPTPSKLASHVTLPHPASAADGGGSRGSGGKLFAGSRDPRNDGDFVAVDGGLVDSDSDSD